MATLFRRVIRLESCSGKQSYKAASNFEPDAHNTESDEMLNVKSDFNLARRQMVLLYASYSTPQGSGENEGYIALPEATLYARGDLLRLCRNPQSSLRR